MGLIVVFGFAVAIAFATYTGGGSRRKRLEELVRSQGWRVEKTYTKAARGYVVARVQDLVVTLSLADEKHIGSTVRIELPSPGAPKFELRPSALTALVGKRIELAPGLAAYTPEPDDTRALFTPARQQTLRTRLADAEVRCDRDAIIIVQPPRLPLGTIVAAVGFAIDLATADRYGTDALRALPGAVYRPTTNERAACIEVDAPSPIRFTALRDDDLVYTEASIEQGKMPSSAPDLSDLGPARLVAHDGGRITLTWPVVERDSRRLAVAVDLLRALAGAPHDGAYRGRQPLPALAALLCMHPLALLVLLSQARTVPAFHAIAIETTADVDVTIGTTTKVEVSGPDDWVGKLETTVEKGSLHIRLPKDSKGKTPTFKVAITMPALDAIAVTGISNVHVAKLSAKELALAVDGAATLHIAGSVQSLALAVSGAAQLELASLDAREAAVQVSGLASGAIHVDDSLAVSLSGTAQLDLYGKPQISKSVSGTLQLRSR